MKRTLNLKREQVVELTTEELAGVVGGEAAPTIKALSCPLRDCLVPTQLFDCGHTLAC